MVERIVGILFALSLIGTSAGASADTPRAVRALVESESPNWALDPTLLQLLDRDQDGRVTEQEFQAIAGRHVLVQARARFARLDRNHDGWVTRAEVPTMETARFRRFDRNRDGAFTVAELIAVLKPQVAQHCRALLNRYDVDGDGALTSEDTQHRVRDRYSRLEPSVSSVR